MASITVTNNIVPSGEHYATLESVEEKIHTFNGLESKRYHFKFKITEGEAKGLFAFGFSPTNPKLGSKLFKFLCMLKGDHLKPNESVELNSFIGQKYLIKVELSGFGKSQVTSFTLTK